MTYLLDVNVLLALLDPSHEHHESARVWFDVRGHLAWATCPITENGAMRILANPRYPNSLSSVGEAKSRLRAFTQLPRYEFWADSISLLNLDRFDRDANTKPSQLTDIYLLSLAIAHGGMFATLDRRIAAAVDHTMAASLHLIQTA